MANQRDISFATFNLLNLNLPGRPIYTDRDGWSAAEYDAKLAWTAERLKALDADVIGFQECWSRQALLECFERAGLTQDYDVVARDVTPARIQVALAARKGLLVGDPAWIEEFPAAARFLDLEEATEARETVSVTISRFSRPLLRVVVQPRGTRPKPPPITVHVAHLKSKGPSRLRFPRERPPVLAEHASIAQSVVSHVRRIAEAGAMRAMLDVEMKGNTNPHVIIGDLNDGTLSISTELLTGNPGYRFIEKSTAGSRSDAGLYTVEKLQQLRSFRHVYYTHVFRQSMESLDHILVSDAFYDHSAGRKWSFNEMIVMNDHLVLDDKSSRTKVGANDHGIVRAQFDWNPMSEALEA
ncbi:MAG: endonuclease/exonuclease/phosphatase family protein [Rhizobiaceae bacterium]|nr:endonuclease/exonuclease/phosphatase family protein [Rhizobiaceae bacterium]MCV0407032.1 endonuclease/exonuclease/phosphatase family protein [Rhizobiaceae bacterium]